MKLPTHAYSDYVFKGCSARYLWYVFVLLASKVFIAAQYQCWYCVFKHSANLLVHPLLSEYLSISAQYVSTPIQPPPSSTAEYLPISPNLGDSLPSTDTLTTQFKKSQSADLVQAFFSFYHKGKSPSHNSAKGGNTQPSKIVMVSIKSPNELEKPQTKNCLKIYPSGSLL